MHTCWPPPVPAYPDRPYGLIHVADITGRSIRGCHYRLVWTRHLYDDGDVMEILTQTRTTSTGQRQTVEVHRSWRGDRRADREFDRLAELYQAITEQADGIPSPGQLSLRLT